MHTPRLTNTRHLNMRAYQSRGRDPVECGQSGGGAAANHNAIRGEPYGGSGELGHNLIRWPRLG
ncbi:hypothetical protein ACWGIU_32310 [Streptomyces sp. NPDC054840]